MDENELKVYVFEYFDRKYPMPDDFIQQGLIVLPSMSRLARNARKLGLYLKPRHNVSITRVKAMAKRWWFARQEKLNQVWEGLVNYG